MQHPRFLFLIVLYLFSRTRSSVRSNPSGQALTSRNGCGRRDRAWCGAQVRDGGEREAGRGGAQPGGGGGAERGRARPALLRASRAAGPA